MFANMASFSVEVIEAENPLEVLDYEFVPDTGGAGKFRGGMSQRKTWRMLADEGILQVRADRQTHRPYGLQGGGPGAAGRNVLDPGLPTEQKLHAKLTMTLRTGQVFRHELPGAGGWGDALTRDLSLVAKDLRDGLVTIEGAARDYGVVARGDPPEIDAAATETLRAQLRRRAAGCPTWRGMVRHRPSRRQHSSDLLEQFLVVDRLAQNRAQRLAIGHRECRSR